MHYLAFVLIPDTGDAHSHVTRMFAPYELETENRAYLHFVPSDNEAARAEYETGEVDHVEKADGTIVRPYDEDLPVPKGATRTNIPFRDLYPSFEAYMEGFQGEHKDPKTGVYGVLENPRGSWDYWQIGGRYMGRFDDYDPRTDPANIDVCSHCDGGGCAGCDETGESTDPIAQLDLV